MSKVVCVSTLSRADIAVHTSLGYLFDLPEYGKVYEVRGRHVDSNGVRGYLLYGLSCYDGQGREIGYHPKMFAPMPDISVFTPLQNTRYAHEYVHNREHDKMDRRRVPG